MVDYYLTADGEKGRFIDLMKTGSYLIFYTHWQSLYGNGTKKGFLADKELVHRINTVLADDVVWMKASEITRYHAARETVTWTMKQETAGTTVIFEAPFECKKFTFSVKAEPVPAGMTVSLNGKAMTQLKPGDKSLDENKWFVQGDRIYICSPLANGMKISISRKYGYPHDFS